MTTNSLVIPIYNNAENIPTLIEAVEGLANSLDNNLEVVFVIDGSPDKSADLLLTHKPSYPAKVVFHSRNFGSFSAIRTGLMHSSGNFIAVMAADLQEPPELILEFFRLLSADEADVVFGTRALRNDPLVRRTLSNIFWAAYRRLVLPAMPPGGVDIFGCNRRVADTVLQIEEPNGSLVAQLFWVGFRRAFVPYHRRARIYGKSAWSLARRFRYMLDSIFSFTDAPILMVLWIGIAGCLACTTIGMVTLVAWLAGLVHAPGYTTIVLLICLFGSLNFVVQGILGSYLWQAVENSKRRPLSIVSQVVQLTP